MMHDFNTVSGMWSDIQLKGRGGRGGGKGTNVEGVEKDERKERREKRGAGGHSSTLSVVRGFFGQGKGLQRGEEKVDGRGGGGGEGKGGAGVAFVCFPRFKASLEK